VHDVARQASTACVVFVTVRQVILEWRQRTEDRCANRLAGSRRPVRLLAPDTRPPGAGRCVAV